MEKYTNPIDLKYMLTFLMFVLFAGLGFILVSYDDNPDIILKLSIVYAVLSLVYTVIEFDFLTEDTKPNTFGLALEALKQGDKAMRLAWLGKNKYILLLNSNEITEAIKQCYSDIQSNHTVVEKALYIHTKHANLIPYNPTQEDLLAEDWIVN